MPRRTREDNPATKPVDTPAPAPVVAPRAKQGPAGAAAPDPEAMKLFADDGRATVPALNFHPASREDALALVRAYRKDVEDRPNREVVDNYLRQVVIGDEQEYVLKDDLELEGPEEFEAQFEGSGVTAEEATRIRECVEAFADWGDRICGANPFV
jgi:hypothetical protein